jgi:hypothetical protein
MKTKYQQFLENVDVISEEKFNEIIDSLPEINIENINFSYLNPDFNDEDEIACIIIDSILECFNYVYVEDVSFSNKTFSLEDVESLEDLEEIKNIFSNWTIDNYDELLEELEEEEKSNKENSEREKLILFITNNATIDQLRKFVNDL